jgi:hypothetical protein
MELIVFVIILFIIISLLNFHHLKAIGIMAIAFLLYLFFGEHK